MQWIVHWQLLLPYPAPNSSCFLFFSDSRTPYCGQKQGGRIEMTHWSGSSFCFAIRCKRRRQRVLPPIHGLLQCGWLRYIGNGTTSWKSPQMPGNRHSQPGEKGRQGSRIDFPAPLDKEGADWMVEGVYSFFVSRLSSFCERNNFYKKNQWRLFSIYMIVVTDQFLESGGTSSISSNFMISWPLTDNFTVSNFKHVTEVNTHQPSPPLKT